MPLVRGLALTLHGSSGSLCSLASQPQFEAIPEVAPSGALVKIAYASGHPRTNSTAAVAALPAARTLQREDSLGSSASSNGGPMGACEAAPLRPSRPVASPRLNGRKRRAAARRSNGTHASSGGFALSDLDSTLWHNFELAGRIETLGEEVEEEDIDEETVSDVGEEALRVGDAVLVMPYFGQPQGYSDYVCSPDLGHLVRLPRGLPLEAAIVVAAGAREALPVMRRLEATVEAASVDQKRPVKILLIGSKPQLLWALHLLPVMLNEESTSVTVATSSEGLLRASKSYPAAEFVQWNEEAYPAVLVERTRDTMGNTDADILVALAAAPKAFQTGIKCLSKSGRVLLTAEAAEVLPSMTRRALERVRAVEAVPTEEYAARSCRELMTMVLAEMVTLPPWSSFASDEGGRVCRLEETGKLEGLAVVNVKARATLAPSASLP